ncbi:MAG: hypothetical protein MJ075_01075 [Oscillospiraceae bacterium]|nr:hypothetical protein [Oscillospiraceae bacterium]
MTMEEAKNFFKQYGGFPFHMSREEPSRYQAYRSLHISEEQEDIWRENLIEAAFQLLEGDPLRWYGDLCRQVKVSVQRRKEFSLLLYQETEKLTCLSQPERAGLLRYLAGSARDYSDGALHVMHGGGVPLTDLQTLVDTMADFQPEEWDNYTRQERESGLKTCENALARLRDGTVL